MSSSDFSKPPVDRRDEHGPFDIIGDVHGCFEELVELLQKLDYEIAPFKHNDDDLISAWHPKGRTAFFVGDLIDRGPRNVDALRLVIGMCANQTAHCVIGNHDAKTSKWLHGRTSSLTHGLERTAAELSTQTTAFRNQVANFIDSLPSHAQLSGGKLVIAHAGLREDMHGKDNGAVRAFAMYGDTNGKKDEYGLPVRLDWWRQYEGNSAVIYGHTPMLETGWVNNTLCIDTGCVYGNKLTALRWPEREIVDVPAKQQYAISRKPLVVNNRTQE